LVIPPPEVPPVFLFRVAVGGFIVSFYDPRAEGHHRVRTVMENLEKSRNFKVVISRPGKVLEKNVITKVWEKSWKCVIFTSSFTPSLKYFMCFKRKTLKI